MPVLGARAADDPTTVTLIEKNSVWKYDDSNADLGTAWRAEGYDDSAWKTGKGPLGYPAGDNNPTFGAISAGTLVANQSSPNAYITSRYWRVARRCYSPGSFPTVLDPRESQ
jgi:hypothetical protein